MERSFRSFSFRLSRRILIVMLLSMLFISGTVFYFAMAAMKVQANMHYVDITEITNDKVDVILSAVEVSAANNVNEIEQNLDSPERVFKALENELRINPHIIGLAAAFVPDYFPEKGRWFEPYVVQRDSNRYEKLEIGSEHHDYLHSPWYKKALAEENGYWSDPYFDDTGARMMLCTYSLPIHDQTGRTVGVFAADVSLEWLTEQLHELDVMENNHGLIKAKVGDKQHASDSFIISRTGQYIVHPERKRILTGHFFDYGDSLTNNSYYQLGKNMLAGKSGYSRAKVDSINSYVFHAPLRRSGWSMAIVVPMFRLIGPGIAIGLLLLVVIAVGLIAVQLLCFYTIRRATRPLSYLAASAGEVAKGRFDAPLPELSHNDEIRLLRDSFENMQTSLAQHIRQLTDTTAQKASLERELNIARGIQMSMLPKTFPPFPERTDIDVFGQLTPAKAVGGDLFDFFIRDEQLFFCIGDVSGKGIPASLVMAMTAAQFHTLSANENRPDLIVSAINEAMSQHNDSLMFVTLFVGVLNLATGRLDYCNAGHNAPILIAGNRDIPTENGEPLDVVPNVPIGVIADYPFALQQTTLVPGTTLLLYTDGLTEAENEQHALFDEHRVFESIGQLDNASPQQLIEHITESVHQFVGAAEQSDDLSMMAIRYQ